MVTQVVEKNVSRWSVTPRYQGGGAPASPNFGTCMCAHAVCPNFALWLNKMWEKLLQDPTTIADARCVCVS